MNSDFWGGKRVFLTGHTGFKGSWLSIWLKDLGARVTGFSLPPPTSPSLFERARVAEGMVSLIGDIRDADTVQRALREACPEIVIHMAAQPLVRESYLDPVGTYATNVLGLVHVLEGVRQTPSVRAVVNVTTDKCYENKEWVWGYRENEPMGGRDPYSSSKACAELVSAAYRVSFFQSRAGAKPKTVLATARAGNVIGGGDWAKDRLVPDILRAAEAGERVLIRNPNAVRPWQHVLEPLRGYLVLAEAIYTDGAKYGEAFNFGPRHEDAWPVGRVTEAICKQWGNGVDWSNDTGTHPHEAGYLALDISKARSVLGWQPAIEIQQALELTVEWTKRLLKGEDAHRLTLEQINKYTQIIAKDHV